VTSSATPFLSPEGSFSLQLPAGWQWQQDSEDGHFVFYPPGGRSVLRIIEHLCEPDGDVRLPQDYFEAMSGDPDLPYERAELNRVPAASRQFVRHEPSGRQVRVRQWVATDQHWVLYATHEVPAEVGEAEDLLIDKVLSSLSLRHEAHPVIASVLERINRESGPRWEWSHSKPLIIRCPQTGHELNVELLIRTVDLNPVRWNRAFEDLIRKIRNLSAFGESLPPFEQIAHSVVPLIRGDVVWEAMQGAKAPKPTDEPIAGASLVRRQWAPDLYVYYAVDIPASFRFIRPEDMAHWNLDAARLEEIALKNLRTRISADTLRFMRESDYRFLNLEDGEGTAASRLLISSFRRYLQLNLGDEFNVALPSAGVLLVFSVGFVRWKQFMGEDVWDAYLAQPIPISRNVYRVTESGVVIDSVEAPA
jgi:hypothetical protein